MRRKIVAITSQYLKEPISQIVSELKLNCDIQVVSYNKFDTISEVYDSYAGDTDGFLISGKIAKAARSGHEKDRNHNLIFLKYFFQWI